MTQKPEVNTALAAEITKISEAIRDLAGARKRSDKAIQAAQRNHQVFCDRFVAIDFEGTPTLEAISKKHNMTRERIRQLTRNMVENARINGIRSPVAKALLDTKDYLRLPRQQLYGFAAFAREMFDAHISVTDPNSIDSRQKSLHEALLKNSLKQVSRNGAAQVVITAGMLANQGINAEMNNEELRQAISAMHGVTWLDEKFGWYTIDEVDGDKPRNRILDQINKVLACAYSSVGVEDLYAHLCRQRQRDMPDAPDTPFVPLPTHVIKALLMHEKSYKHCGFDLFELKVANKEEERSKYLSEAEMQVYKSLVKLGGIGSRAEVRDLLGDAININTLTMAWERSPILWGLEKGICRLPGYPLESQSLQRAKSATKTDDERTDHR